MSLLKDLHNTVVHTNVMPPANPSSGNTARVCTVVNMEGYRGLEYVILTGSLADADATFTTLMEESDDDSTYTSVADADMNGTEAGASFTFTHDNSLRKIGYIGNKLYNRLTITPATNTGDQFLAVVAEQIINAQSVSDQTS